jgi:hypothetical protein
LPQRLPQDKANILDRMVLVNLEIAARRNLKIESAMTGEQLEHVIEKVDAGGNLVASAPVQVQADVDVGLGGFAVDACLPRPHANHPVWE